MPIFASMSNCHFKSFLKRNSKNFRGRFYVDVIYKDESYLWSSEEIRIRA